MLKNIPPITRNLLFINVIIYMVQVVLKQRIGHDIMVENFGLHFYLAEDFRIWQLVTYMFLHGSTTHVLFNMFSLWMFGRIIEENMTQKQFLLYYFVCGIGAGICQEVWQTADYLISGMGQYDFVNLNGIMTPMGDYLNLWTTIGASGACYGILLAFGMLFPNERIMLLFPPIPMKAKYFVIVFAVIELLSAFSSDSNIAHFAHLGGMLFGYLLLRQWMRNARRTNVFTGWENYTPHARQQNMGLMQRTRRAFENFGAALEEGVRSIGRALGFGKKNDKGPRYNNQDYDYNARKNQEKSQEQQKRINEILDKVRRSGYDSLTEDEKNELFNHK